MQHSSTSLSDLLGEAEIEPVPSEGISGIMTEAELASLLGLSVSRIRSLATEGVLPRSSRGRFDVRACLRIYLDRLRESAARAGRPIAAGSDEYKAERLRLTRAQAEAQEIKNRLSAGYLVPVDSVRREWVTVATDLRAQILAIPARVASRMALSRDAAVSLEDELRAALEELK